MTTFTPRPFVSPTDLPAVLTLMRQSATAETLFDVPRYSDLESWLAPAGVVVKTSREDENYRHQMIQQGTALWETAAGEAAAYAMIPFTTSLRFGILPRYRSRSLQREILAWHFCASGAGRPSSWCAATSRTSSCRPPSPRRVLHPNLSRMST